MNQKIHNWKKRKQKMQIFYKNQIINITKNEHLIFKSQKSWKIKSTTCLNDKN